MRFTDDEIRQFAAALNPTRADEPAPTELEQQDEQTEPTELEQQDERTRALLDRMFRNTNRSTN